MVLSFGCFYFYVLLFFFVTNDAYILIRVKNLKNIPVYLKPQLSSDSGNCRIDVLVGIRNDPGKTIDSVTVKFQLPLCIASADLTSNYGTVNILADKVSAFFN